MNFLDCIREIREKKLTEAKIVSPVLEGKVLFYNNLRGFSIVTTENGRITNVSSFKEYTIPLKKLNTGEYTMEIIKR